MESSTASPESDEIVHAEQGEDAVSENVDEMVQSGSHGYELEKEEDPGCGKHQGSLSF